MEINKDNKKRCRDESTKDDKGTRLWKEYCENAGLENEKWGKSQLIVTSSGPPPIGCKKKARFIIGNTIPLSSESGEKGERDIIGRGVSKKKMAPVSQILSNNKKDIQIKFKKDNKNISPQLSVLHGRESEKEKLIAEISKLNYPTEGKSQAFETEKKKSRSQDCSAYYSPDRAIQERLKMQKIQKERNTGSTEKKKPPSEPDTLKHRKHPGKQQNYICIVCSKKCSSIHSRKEHQAKEHRIHILFCSFCKEEFYSKQDREQHIVDEHRDQVAKCYVCYKQFYTTRYLNEHLLKEHGVTILFCSFCQEEFFTEQDLKRHIFAKHKKKLAKCPVCMKKIYCHNQGNYYFPLPRIPLRLQNKIECPVCQNRYGSFPGFKSHMDAKHDSRYLECENCYDTITILSSPPGRGGNPFKLQAWFQQCQQQQEIYQKQQQEIYQKQQQKLYKEQLDLRRQQLWWKKHKVVL